MSIIGISEVLCYVGVVVGSFLSWTTRNRIVVHSTDVFLHCSWVLLLSSAKVQTEPTSAVLLSVPESMMILELVRAGKTFLI